MKALEIQRLNRGSFGLAPPRAVTVYYDSRHKVLKVPVEGEITLLSSSSSVNRTASF